MAAHNFCKGWQVKLYKCPHCHKILPEGMFADSESADLQDFEPVILKLTPICDVDVRFGSKLIALFSATLDCESMEIMWLSGRLDDGRVKHLNPSELSEFHASDYNATQEE